MFWTSSSLLVYYPSWNFYFGWPPANNKPSHFYTIASWLGLESNIEEAGEETCFTRANFLSLQLLAALSSGLASLLLQPPDQTLCPVLGSLPILHPMDEGRASFTPRVQVSSSNHFPWQASDFQGLKLSRGFSRKTQKACARPASAHISMGPSGCLGNTAQSELDLLYLFSQYPCLWRSPIQATQERKKNTGPRFQNHVLTSFLTYCDRFQGELEND